MLAKLFSKTHMKLVAAAAALLVLVAGVVGARWILSPEAVSKSSIATTTVQTATVEGLMQKNDSLEFVGEVVADTQIQIRPQAQGEIVRVSAEEGQRVEAGQVLARIEADTQSANVQQARSNTTVQAAQLQGLRQNAGRGQRGSLLSDTISQQRQLTTNAYRSLLNTDLQAYPEDPADRAGPAPSITGYYTGNKEGRYIIEVYESSGRLGASFEVSGIENKIYQEVNTDTPVPLGKHGLYIQFPEDFQTNQTWIVPIPNTRSNQYATALNAYESTKVNGELSINQTRTDEEEIRAQQARVASAEANLAATRAAEEKTIITAPTDGVLSDFSVDAGDVVSLNSQVGTVVGEGEREIHVFVTNQQAERMAVGADAYIDGKRVGSVGYIADVIDPATDQRELHIDVDAAEEITVGESVDMTIQQSADLKREDIRIPITALQVTADGAQVLSIGEDNRLEAVPVTPGRLIGDEIIIREGLSLDSAIIADARGLKAGDTVIVSNE